MFNFLKKKSQTLGARGEGFAQDEYKKRGYTIVATNAFNRKGKQVGEIDFIARNKDSIVFVEVKTRTSSEGKFGTPAEAVNVFKQQKFLKAVKFYLAAHPEFRSLRPQIDVCAVVLSSIDKTPESVILMPNVVEDQF
jgi:putative endonuclease